MCWYERKKIRDGVRVSFLRVFGGWGFCGEEGYGGGLGFFLEVS